jgi:hypothetical protein
MTTYLESSSQASQLKGERMLARLPNADRWRAKGIATPKVLKCNSRAPAIPAPARKSRLGIEPEMAGAQPLHQKTPGYIL